MNGNGKDIERRLRRVESQVEKIPGIQESLARIEKELIGDRYGNHPSFRGRLETLEEDEIPQMRKRIVDVEEEQDAVKAVSAGGAGFITVTINAVKEFFL